METGKVVEIIGAVIDVQFPREAMPNIFDALLIEEGDLTLEVQQQIGDGIVRTIAMGTTDGSETWFRCKKHWRSYKCSCG